MNKSAEGGDKIAAEGVGGEDPGEAGPQPPPGASAVIFQPMRAFEQSNERLDAVADSAQERARGRVLRGRLPPWWRRHDPPPRRVQCGPPGRRGRAAEGALADEHQPGRE